MTAPIRRKPHLEGRNITRYPLTIIILFACKGCIGMEIKRDIEVITEVITDPSDPESTIEVFDFDKSDSVFKNTVRWPVNESRANLSAISKGYNRYCKCVFPFDNDEIIVNTTDKTHLQVIGLKFKKPYVLNQDFILKGALYDDNKDKTWVRCDVFEDESPYFKVLCPKGGSFWRKYFQIFIEPLREHEICLCQVLFYPDPPEVIKPSENDYCTVLNNDTSSATLICDGNITHCCNNQIGCHIPTSIENGTLFIEKRGIDSNDTRIDYLCDAGNQIQHNGTRIFPCHMFAKEIINSFTCSLAPPEDSKFNFTLILTGGILVALVIFGLIFLARCLNRQNNPSNSDDPESPNSVELQETSQDRSVPFFVGLGASCFHPFPCERRALGSSHMERQEDPSHLEGVPTQPARIPPSHPLRANEMSPKRKNSKSKKDKKQQSPKPKPSKSGSSKDAKKKEPGPKHVHFDIPDDEKAKSKKSKEESPKPSTSAVALREERSPTRAHSEPSSSIYDPYARSDVAGSPRRSERHPRASLYMDRPMAMFEKYFRRRPSVNTVTVDRNATPGPSGDTEVETETQEEEASSTSQQSAQQSTGEELLHTQADDVKEAIMAVTEQLHNMHDDVELNIRNIPAALLRQRLRVISHRWDIAHPEDEDDLELHFCLDEKQIRPHRERNIGSQRIFPSQSTAASSGTSKKSKTGKPEISIHELAEKLLEAALPWLQRSRRRARHRQRLQRSGNWAPPASPCIDQLQNQPQQELLDEAAAWAAPPPPPRRAPQQQLLDEAAAWATPTPPPRRVPQQQLLDEAAAWAAPPPPPRRAPQQQLLDEAAAWAAPTLPPRRAMQQDQRKQDQRQRDHPQQDQAQKEMLKETAGSATPPPPPRKALQKERPEQYLLEEAAAWVPPPPPPRRSRQLSQPQEVLQDEAASYPPPPPPPRRALQELRPEQYLLEDAAAWLPPPPPPRRTLQRDLLMLAFEEEAAALAPRLPPRRALQRQPSEPAIPEEESASEHSCQHRAKHAHPKEAPTSAPQLPCCIYDNDDDDDEFPVLVPLSTLTMALREQETQRDISAGIYGPMFLMPFGELEEGNIRQYQPDSSDDTDSFSPISFRELRRQNSSEVSEPPSPCELLEDLHLEDRLIDEEGLEEASLPGPSRPRSRSGRLLDISPSLSQGEQMSPSPVNSPDDSTIPRAPRPRRGPAKKKGPLWANNDFKRYRNFEEFCELSDSPEPRVRSTSDNNPVSEGEDSDSSCDQLEQCYTDESESPVPPGTPRVQRRTKRDSKNPKDKEEEGAVSAEQEDELDLPPYRNRNKCLGYPRSALSKTPRVFPERDEEVGPYPELIRVPRIRFYPCDDDESRDDNIRHQPLVSPIHPMFRRWEDPHYPLPSAYYFEEDNDEEEEEDQQREDNAWGPAPPSADQPASDKEIEQQRELEAIARAREENSKDNFNF